MDKREQDMNLFDFVLLCWDGLKRLFFCLLNWLMQTVRLGLRYFWIVAIGVAIGVGAAWLLTRKPLTKFTGRATVYVTEGMKPAVINGIKMFFTTGDTTRFRRYNIPRESVYAVRYLEFNDIVDLKCDSVPDYIDTDGSVSLSDTSLIVMPDRFSISFKMKGIDDFFPFMYAFTAYLHHQPQIEQADIKAKARMQAKLDYLDHEVARLDSFMTYDYFVKPRYYNTQGWGATHIITEREQKLYSDELRRLTRERDWVKQQVELTPEILNFETPFIVTAPPRIEYYKYGIVLGGIFGLLLALLFKYRKQVFGYLREKN